MPRHEQPREIAALKGADKKNPQRYKSTPPKAKTPLGNYPKDRSTDPEACWFEISSFCIPGVLTGADRFMMEIASDLMAEYRKSPVEFPAAKYAHLIGVLARFGLSPTDRNKLGVDKPDASANPFAALDD